MNKLSDYEEVNKLLGENLATLWLTYKVDEAYFSEQEIELELRFIDYEDKVLYLPFVLNKRLVKITNV